MRQTFSSSVPSGPSSEAVRIPTVPIQQTVALRPIMSTRTSRIIAGTCMLVFLLSLAWLWSSYEGLILLPIAQNLERFEAEILHMPLNLRYFSGNETDRQRCAKAAMMLAMPIHSFITFPVMNYVAGKQHAWSGYLATGMEVLGNWIWMTAGVWSAFLMVRILA